MGVVYEAVDTERNVRVALKTLQALSAEGLLSFKREFRDFQDLEHPNLVNLGELHAEGGQWFFTMELLEGSNFLESVTGRTTRSSISTESWSATKRLPSPAPSPPAINEPVFATQEPPQFDPDALRDGLRQLGRGLIALHDAGKVHRDIKPSNVLVTSSNRVVLLDYGVATSSLLSVGQLEATIVGTVAYMAPEQAAGRTVGPEADWYSVGVMLFEAMTGALPIIGAPIELMEAKQTTVPPLASTLNPRVPPDLDGLCADLLQIDPALRPTGRQALDRLGGRQRRAGGDAARQSSQMIGRSTELKMLENAYTATTNGAPVNACIIAPSGLGKTMLARQFLANVAKRPGVVVLRGACYEREAVPHNGFDGLIDSLSVYLGRLSPSEVSALMPPNAYLLTQAFPVLSTSAAMAAVVKPALETPDPQELRKQLFAACRELFHRVAKTCTLVLFIDDLQWLGPDSFALLTELTRPPNAPPVVWVTTVRAEAEGEAEVTAWSLQVEAMLGQPPTSIRLSRLTSLESAELARTLSASTRLSSEQIDTIARESGGHPLFIDELMRQATIDPDITGKAIDLDAAIWQRLTSLEDELQRAVVLLTLAPGRLTQATLSRATNIDPARWTKVLNALRAAHLVRTHGMRASDQVEPYHGRIRTAVRAHLPAEVAKGHHLRLAETLELDAHPDVEALSFHWAEAGQTERAAIFALQAAEKANRALAFDRAAGFFRQGLDLRPTQQQPAVWVQLAEALVNAGRGAEAAEAYLRAASMPQTDALDLQRRAAEQYLRSGHIDRGIQLMSDVLTAVDLSPPRTPQSALIDLLWHRARLRLRGLKFTLQPSVDPANAQKLDATWSASNGFSMVDPIRGANFQTQNLLLALKVGAPERLANALAMEAAFIACDGHSQRERAISLVKQAEGLTKQVSSEGLATLVRGVIAFQNGEWAEARRWLLLAGTILRERCTGMTWERDSCDFFTLATLFYLGEFKELQTAVPRLLLDADSRGDLYAGSNVRLSTINSVWLSTDQPDVARSHASLAIGRWSNRGYLAHSYYFFVAEVNRLLYEGKSAEAWAVVQQNWAPLKRSLLLRVQVVRVEANSIRARAAFAAGALREGKASVCVLEKEPLPYAAALAGLLRASSALLERKPKGEIIEQLTDARQKLNAAGMKAYAAAAQWSAAKLSKDPKALADVREASAALGIQSADRFLAMMGTGKLTDEIDRS